MLLLNQQLTQKANLDKAKWALLKLESCCEGMKRLFSTAMAGQDNVLAQKAFLFLGREWLQRRQIIRLRCHNFELIKPTSWRSGYSHRRRRGELWVRFLGRYRPLAQLPTAKAVEAEGLGSDSLAGRIGTVLPSARHRCDVSVFP